MLQPESACVTELHHFLGAFPLTNSVTRFCVWAPATQQVSVWLPDQDRLVPMSPRSGGYHVAEIEGAGIGDRYLFRLGNQTNRPDPASRYQPEGVHGPSQIVSRDFEWNDQSWPGVSTQDMIIYELHVGTFTADGTCLAAIDRLDQLIELGVNTIELMPVAEAPGKWNWGYDGVYLFAPNHNYGTPADLKRLVDAAHRKGLAVILDVVYNHIGPEGNYLRDFGPYLSPKHCTPWGDAPNFDDPKVGRQLRRFVTANAVHWFDDFHLDGLRVDAIHCMKDDSDLHIATEISDAVECWAEATGKPAKLIAESNVYDPEMTQARNEGGSGFHAQWCDDFLHSLFAVVRPSEQLCHRSYRSKTDLDQTLRMGYVYEGTLRRPPVRSRPDSRVDTSGLIYSIQNHDFIGNHPLGQRFHQLTSPPTQRAAAALLILGPAIPMLFMGEEFCADQPFRFFVDFSDQRLRTAVVAGRRREYPQHDWSLGRLPTDELAFMESKIGPAADGDPITWSWYQSLIKVRKSWRSNGLLRDQNLTVESDMDVGYYCLRYSDTKRSASVAVRLNSETEAVEPLAISLPGDVVLNSRPDELATDRLLPNHALVLIAERRG